MLLHRSCETTLQKLVSALDYVILKLQSGNLLGTGIHQLLIFDALLPLRDVLLLKDLLWSILLARLLLHTAQLAL